MTTATVTNEKFNKIKAEENIVSVIVPLYGFWSNDETEHFMPENLKIFLSRIASSKNKVYIIFVGDTSTLDERIINIIQNSKVGGNAKGLSIRKGASYNEYLNVGIDYAIHETKSRFFMVCNPWVMLKTDSIDIMVSRLNKHDVGFVSGYNVADQVSPEKFDEFFPKAPMELRDFDYNFWGTVRSFIESVNNFDENYLTHSFVGRDLWQTCFKHNLEAIVSQYLPYYRLSVDWTKLEPKEDFDADRARFIDKWRFAPDDINYERSK